MKRAFVVALGLVCARPAFAYNEAIHAFITGRALAAEPGAADELLPPSQRDLDAFRAIFWQAASADPRFAARYPSLAAFDAWAFKELLLLDPAAKVHGFDLTPDDARPMKRLALLEAASRWPDDDQRNQHRYLRDPATHEIVRAADGEPTPYDPATLDLGSLTTSTSQGHAHYGLVPGPLSDDPAVLKSDPRRFAIPPTVHAYGADFAQLYTDLAALALASELPSRQWLACTFEGAAFHHLEDVANQIHTVQVGIYEFFEAAFVQSKLRDVKTLGGLLGPRRSLKQLGLRLIGNHHLLSEDLFAKRVREVEGRAAGAQPLVAAAVEGLERDDEDFARPARAAMSSGQLGRALADTMIEQSSHEGPEAYRLAWAITKPSLHDGMGHEYDGAKDDPDAWVQAGPGAEKALAAFYELESRGLHRAATALRLWSRAMAADNARSGEAAKSGASAKSGPLVARTVAFLLPVHAQAAERRARYRPAEAEHPGIAWGYPIAALVLVVAVALIAARLLRRRAR